MNEIPKGIPGAELTSKPDRNPGIKDSWIRGFVDGNKRWPEETRGIAIYTAAAMLKDPPANWSGLLHAKLTGPQLSHTGAVATALHRLYDVSHAFDTEKKPIQPAEHPIGNNRMQILWDDVQGRVVDTISHYVDAFSPKPKDQGRPREVKVTEIQDFFTDPENQPHIKALTDTFAAAKVALETDDSIDFSNDYKTVISQSVDYEMEVDFLRDSYKRTFPEIDIFDDDPGRWAWELAAHNVRNALETSFPEQDISWLELDTR